MSSPMSSEHADLNEQEINARIEQLQQERSDHLAKAVQIDTEITELKTLQREKAAQVIAEIAKRAGLEITVKTTREPRAAKGGEKRKLPPKFRDPATGKTWSGKGKRPHWVRESHRIVQ